MIPEEVEKQVIDYILSQMTKKDVKRELGRFIVRDYATEIYDRVNLWAIREDERSLHEQQLDIEDKFPGTKATITFVKQDFFRDVIEQEKDVPFWQVATAVRVLNNADPVYDPQDLVKMYIEEMVNIKWSPGFITLKRNTAFHLMDRAFKHADDDMMADAYFWMIKAAEEAICVPLMKKNLFNITTPTLLLDTLEAAPKIHEFYTGLLGVNRITPEEAKDAIKELDKLAEHLYYKNIRTPREMWILTSYVSINECERRLQELHDAKGKVDDKIQRRLWEAVIGELWQAIFLIAQTPGGQVMLDPWVVGLFWKWMIKTGTGQGLRKMAMSVKKIALT
ncbi:MAG: hypothetical protein ACXAEU_04815 [Candidatus Hodarchaeales archaeon]|jgi:hypothetical protein